MQLLYAYNKPLLYYVSAGADVYEEYDYLVTCPMCHRKYYTWGKDLVPVENIKQKSYASVCICRDCLKYTSDSDKYKDSTKKWNIEKKKHGTHIYYNMSNWIGSASKFINKCIMENKGGFDPWV